MPPCSHASPSIVCRVPAAHARSALSSHPQPTHPCRMAGWLLQDPSRRRALQRTLSRRDRRTRGGSYQQKEIPNGKRWPPIRTQYGHNTVREGGRRTTTLLRLGGTGYLRSAPTARQTAPEAPSGEVPILARDAAVQLLPNRKPPMCLFLHGPAKPLT